MKKLTKVRYARAIIPFFIFSIFIIALLLYFANITSKIEKENYNLKNKINFIQEQININEIEFSLFNSYEYLIRIQKIYFKKIDKNNFDNRVSYSDFEIKDLGKLYTIGTKKN